jgi:hypothetical protein
MRRSAQALEPSRARLDLPLTLCAPREHEVRAVPPHSEEAHHQVCFRRLPPVQTQCRGRGLVLRVEVPSLRSQVDGWFREGPGDLRPTGRTTDERAGQRPGRKRPLSVRRPQTQEASQQLKEGGTTAP